MPYAGMVVSSSWCASWRNELLAVDEEIIDGYVPSTGRCRLVPRHEPLAAFLLSGGGRGRCGFLRRSVEPELHLTWPGTECPHSRRMRETMAVVLIGEAENGLNSREDLTLFILPLFKVSGPNSNSLQGGL